MTKQEAKKLTLEVWRYLRDHPEIYTKKDLPKEYRFALSGLRNACPLCEYFTELYELDGDTHENVCADCPIHIVNETYPSYDYYCELYFTWDGADTCEKRRKAASKIVELVEAW